MSVDSRWRTASPWSDTRVSKLLAALQGRFTTSTNYSDLWALIGKSKLRNQQNVDSPFTLRPRCIFMWFCIMQTSRTMYGYVHWTTWTHSIAQCLYIFSISAKFPPGIFSPKHLGELTLLREPLILTKSPSTFAEKQSQSCKKPSLCVSVACRCSQGNREQIVFR